MGSRWRSRAPTDKTKTATLRTDQLYVVGGRNLGDILSNLRVAVYYPRDLEAFEAKTRLELTKFKSEISISKTKNQITRVQTFLYERHKVC